MKIRDFIKRAPVAAGPDASLEEAARLMAQHGVGAVAIVDAAGRPIGIITERDVVRAVASRAPPTAKVVEVGTVGNLLTARLDDDIYDVVKNMRERRIRHLLVVDSEGRLAGVLSIRDFLEDHALKTLGDRVWWPKPED